MPHARSKEPLPVITAHPEDEPLVCLQVNEHWIPYIIGALWPMKFPEYWAGTLDENRNARRDAVNLIAIFQQAMEDCGMSSGCCDGSDLTVVVKVRVTIDGRVEISIDNGQTWSPSPNDLANQVVEYPPPVTAGVSANKCDAATNGHQHFLDMIAAISTGFDETNTLIDFVKLVCDILVDLLLIYFGAGLGVPAIDTLIEVLFGAIKAVYDGRKAAWDDYWTTDNTDIILCALFCNISDDGTFTGQGYADVISDLQSKLPTTDQSKLLIAQVQAMGREGLNKFCAYGSTAGADCSSCDCTCTADNYIVDGTRGVELSRTGTSITVQGVLSGGQYEAAVKLDAGMNCCHITMTAIVGTIGTGVWNACADGYHDPYTNGGTALDKLNSLLAASLSPLTVQFDFA